MIWIIHAIWLVLNNDLLQDRRMDNVTINNILLFMLSCKTNGFHVTVGLHSNRSQKTSIFGNNITDALGGASCSPFFILAAFWAVIYHLKDVWQNGLYLLNRAWRHCSSHCVPAFWPQHPGYRPWASSKKNELPCEPKLFSYRPSKLEIVGKFYRISYVLQFRSLRV